MHGLDDPCWSIHTYWISSNILIGCLWLPHSGAARTPWESWSYVRIPLTYSSGRQCVLRYLATRGWSHEELVHNSRAGAANVPVTFRAMLVNLTDQGHLDRLQRLLEHCKSLRKDNLTSPLRVDLSEGRISLLRAPGTKHIEVISLYFVLFWWRSLILRG